MGSGVEMETKEQNSFLLPSPNARLNNKSSRGTSIWSAEIVVTLFEIWCEKNTPVKLDNCLHKRPIFRNIGEKIERKASSM